MGLNILAKRILRRSARITPLRGFLIGCYETFGTIRYGLLGSKGGWNRKHPFDRANGVKTSGLVPNFLLNSNNTFNTALGNGPYAASQPSIIRKALTQIPEPQNCHFLDIGCGKGRPLLIAAEFGFLTITGIEMSPTLARHARRNVAAFMRHHYPTAHIEVVAGDALTYRLPDDDLIIFLYHPFGEQLMMRLRVRIETLLRTSDQNLYVVYYNPVAAKVFDASVALERRYAAQIPYDSSEIGYGPNDSDAVIIWQNRGNPYPRQTGHNPNARVVNTIPGLRADIETGQAP
jgi:SAM-dependent methyltransferase